MTSKPFRDRDYLQDQQGDIYQVIGSIHPQGKVIALLKYKRVNPEEGIQIHKNLIPSNDPISRVRNHELMYWTQKPTLDVFIRVLPNYSSKSAEENIRENRYTNFNTVFQMKLIQIPCDQIKQHWHPQQRLQEILTIFQTGSFEEKQKLDRLERETIEVGLSLTELFTIPIDDIGVTGSILWQSQHEKSDIDIIIYGNENANKILQSPLVLSSEKRGLRRYRTTEILPLAEKMALKTGRPMEECFEYIYHKKYLFFYNKRKVSITFAPKLMELIHYPFFDPNTIFSALKPVRIQAKIKNSRWGYFYPSIFEIDCLDVLEGKEIVQKSTISRLMVYEHELVGFFASGDTVEIRGLLQQASKVPSFYDESLINTFQIFLGGQETFGNEYIRPITEKMDLNG